jgi:RHS repeat-associated protein
VSRATSTTLTTPPNATERLRDHRHSTPQNPELHRETYNYDAAANLMQSGRGSGYVKHNRVHVFEDKRYRYDRFGRLSEKRIGSHTVQRFRYDAEQRLVCVEQDQGWQRLRSEYQYDPLGRRIGKRVYRNGSEQPQSDVQFVWQGLRLLQEVEHGFGSVYVYADTDSYEPLARIDGKPGSEEIFYFHTNLAGLPEQLTDEAGLSVWHSEYEGWGKSRDEWHDQRVRRDQNLRFKGQYLDRETGLHYNTFRFYDPEVGRFTQPDPIGLLGGLNLYQYAPNSTGWIDPGGLASCGASPNKKTAQVTINQAAGKSWEKVVTQSARNKYGAKNVHEQVYIRRLDASGKPVNYRVIVDNAITQPTTLIRLVDAKASTTAGYTKIQTKGYPLIQQNGETIESGTLKGTQVPPTTVLRIDPTKINTL